MRTANVGRAVLLSGALLGAAALGAGCADADNPTALAELEPQAELEWSVARLETFEEVEVHARVLEGGRPMGLREAELEMTHEASGNVFEVPLDPVEDGHHAHVTFFEPGTYHVHLMGMPHRHHLMAELGEFEIEVHRRHEVIGPYWVELAVTPAPVLEGSRAHVHLYIFELDAGGGPGAPASGLDVTVELHDPAGGEIVAATTEEEPGTYEAEFPFGAAGLYELHVEIDVGGQPATGEFHIPVLSPETGGQGTETGGGGHGH